MAEMYDTTGMIGMVEHAENTPDVGGRIISSAVDSITGTFTNVLEEIFKNIAKIIEKIISPLTTALFRGGNLGQLSVFNIRMPRLQITNTKIQRYEAIRRLTTSILNLFSYPLFIIRLLLSMFFLNPFFDIIFMVLVLGLLIFSSLPAVLFILANLYFLYNIAVKLIFKVLL